jgi:hypothetical protein
VYKVILQKLHMEVTVKKVSHESNQGMKEETLVASRSLNFRFTDVLLKCGLPLS